MPFDTWSLDRLDRTFKRSLFLIVLLIGLAAWAYARVASAQEGAVEPSADIIGQRADEAFQAVANGDWWILAATLLSIAVFFVRQWGVQFLPEKAAAFISSDRGGVVLTIAGAVVGGLLTVAKSHVPFGTLWFSTVFKVALASMGGFVGVKKLIFSKPAPPPVLEAK